MGRRLSSSSQLGKGPGTVAAPSPKPMRSLAEALDRSAAAGRKSGGTGKQSVMNKVCSLAPLSSSRGAMDKSGNCVMSISERPGSSGGAVGAEPRQRLSPPSSSGGGAAVINVAAAKNLDASVTSSFRFGDGDSLPSERENATPPLLARPVEERIAGGGAQSWSGGVQESRVLQSISCGNENDRSGRFRHSFEAYKAASRNNNNMEEGETFQDRALRFQSEDWALLSERWREGRKVCKDDSKASSRKKGGVLSPSASSECSSSLFSTIDSTSSLSSRSEASSFFLKGDGSPASVIPVLHCPRLAMPPAMSLPPSSMSQQQQPYGQGGLQRCGSTGGGRCSAAAEGKDKVRALLLPQEEDSQLATGGGSFLEFDFRGGRMVESQEPPPASGGGAAEAGDALTFEFAGPMNSSQELGRLASGDKQCSGMTTTRSSIRIQSLASFRHHQRTEENAVEDDVSASGFATPQSVFFSATTRSPESVFCSPDQRLTRGASLGSETEMTEYLIDRSNNDWDLCRYDSDPSAAGGTDHDRRTVGRRASCSDASPVMNSKESVGLGTTSNSAAIGLLPIKSSDDDASLRPLRGGVTRHTTTLPVKGIVTGRPPSSPQVAAAQGPEALLLSRTASQPPSTKFQLPATGKQSPLAGAASSSDWSEEDRPLLSGGASEHSSRHPAAAHKKENGAPSSTRSKKSSASPGATTKRSSSSPLGVSSSKTCPSPSTTNRSSSSPMLTKGGGSGATAAASKISGSPLGRISSSLVQGLRTTSSSSSPARRNLYSTFKDSKLSHAIHDTFHPGLRGPKTEIPQQYGRASMSPVRSWLDPVKESRASILASWASMSGGGHGQSEEAGLLRTSVSDSGTDLDSADVSESHRRGSKLKNSFRRKENRGALAATLYRVTTTSPVMPRPPRLSSSSLKHSSYGAELLKPLLPAGLRTPTTSAAVPSSAKLSAKVSFSGKSAAHSLSQRVHSFVSRSSTALATATTDKSGGRVGGQMQCVYRDGAPSYSLVMDDTEEMFVAKLGKPTDSLDVYNDLVFTIYRWKGKARGKSGWRSWGKKDKPVCEYVGKLRVASTLCDETSCSGEVKYYVESECVFADVLDHEAPHSGVLTVLRTSQLSASAWDSPTPGRSPWLQHSSSPASSSYFSPLGPASFGSPPVHVADASSSQGGGGGSGRNWMLSPPDDREASKEAKENNTNSTTTTGHGHDKFPLPLDKPLLLCGSRASPPPGQQASSRPRRSFQDLWSDSDATDEFDMRPSTSCPSHTELAAVVIRTPVDRDLAFLQGANLAPGEKTGWGLNFLRRRTVRPSSSSAAASRSSSRNAAATSDHDDEVYYSSSTYRDVSDLCSDCGHCYACGSDAAAPADPADLLLKCGSQSSSCASADKAGQQQRRKLCELQKMEDNLTEHGKVGPGELMVNVILPAGTHTFTSTGVAGPQPLISRWRAGGKCDCGNWDEGCGLTVLETKLSPLSCDPQQQQQQQQQHVVESSSCKIYSLGKKDQIALDISQQGHQDGMFSISFKEPMDSVQAFATAVAVLRCREPFLPVTNKRAADPKRKPPRFPLRQVNSGNEANLLRQVDGQINVTGGGYFVSCPADPPLSPYHHHS